MTKVFVTRISGEEVTIDSQARTLMEALRDNGVSELLALCGGACSCSTCHVWVEQNVFDRLPRATSQEEELLDGLENMRRNSRLGCQISLTPELDGVRVTLPPCD